MNHYIVAGIVILICIIAIVVSLRVLKDTRKMQSDNPKEEDDDFTINS